VFLPASLGSSLSLVCSQSHGNVDDHGDDHVGGGDVGDHVDDRDDGRDDLGAFRGPLVGGGHVGHVHVDAHEERDCRGARLGDADGLPGGEGEGENGH